ncbi:MAG: hypothetical protein VYC67_05005 [Pseudomonadota bacterium]|nr:hypothetical protein [Pseudomonadota bacterium]
MHRESLRITSTIADLNLQWSGFSITEGDYAEICSFSSPLNKDKQLNEMFLNIYNVSLPSPGKIAHYEGGSIFWSSPSQWFISSKNHNPFFDRDIVDKFMQLPIVTLQTDGWVSMNLKGSACLTVLERLVKLNLNDSEFPPGSSTRTGCSHMTIFLQRPNQETDFIVLGARSYAQSLLHALVKTADNVLGERK